MSFSLPADSPSSALVKKSAIEVDDDQPGEWNTITGVSVETDVVTEMDPEPDTAQLFGGERTSLMKTITNLWTGNPANFLSLEYPRYSLNKS